MANNKILIKRTSVSGRVPNTSQIDTGELGINLTDKKAFSSNGTVIFEIGANLSSLYITGSITANGSTGANQAVLSSNGTSVYWANNESQVFSTVVDSFSANGTQNSFGLSINSTSTDSYVAINGVDQHPANSYIIAGNNITFNFNPANGSLIVVKTPTFTPAIYSDLIKTTDVGSNSISLNNNAVIAVSSSNTVNTSTVAIDTFSTGYRSAKYVLQIKHNTTTSFQACELLVIHDGTTAISSEYNLLYSNNIVCNFSTDISGGNVRLLATPTVSNTTIKYTRTVIQA